MKCLNIRRVLLPALAFSIGLATAGFEEAQAQISVIVGPSNGEAVTQDGVAGIFRGATTTWGDGTKIQIVDQQVSEVGKKFYAEVVQQSPDGVNRVFMSLALSGQALKPKKFTSDAEVKAAVASTPGAIGFIQSASLDASVKEVLRID